MKIIKLVTGSFQTNTYIIINNGQSVVIDPGADFDRILDTLKYNHATADYVFLTHCHFDHIGAVRDLQNIGAKIYISNIDYNVLLENDFNIDLGFGSNPVKSFTPYEFFYDKQNLNVIDCCFTIHATPGHTPGGVCIALDDILFTGDTLFKNSIGRTDFNYSNHKDLLNSIDKIFSFDTDYKILPGHCDSSTLNLERKFNPYAKRNRY